MTIYTLNGEIIFRFILPFTSIHDVSLKTSVANRIAFEIFHTFSENKYKRVQKKKHFFYRQARWKREDNRIVVDECIVVTRINSCKSAPFKIDRF